MNNLENNNKNETVSTHKTNLENFVVLDFLKNYYKKDVSNLTPLVGGEASQAFGYNVNGQDLVIRINKHFDRGFKKEKYAYNNFKSLEIPIPKILDIGQLEDGQYFVISEKVDGELFKNLNDEEFDKNLPSLFSTLESIHSIDVSDKIGYGKFDIEGIGQDKSWKEYLLKVDEHAIHMFDNSMLEKDVWDKIYKRFTELISFCPEEKYLVHGDYNFGNLFSKNEKIAGVIDWESSTYGDFLYDVARLQFFTKDFDYEKAYLDFCNKIGKNIENFKERILCYQLRIGLSSLSFYAYSKQKDKYESCKNKLLNLIV